MDLHPSSSVPSLPLQEPVEVQRASGISIPTPTQHHKTPEWVQALQIVAKHWRLSASFAAIVAATTAIITLSMKPVFEPVARIEVDPRGESFSLDGGAHSSDTEYLETQ